MVVEKEKILELFPELALVENKEWVDKACAMWKRSFDASGWDCPEAARFGHSTPEISLIEHTRAVTKMAISIADIYEEMHGNVKIDRDVLIMVSVLHDVSKALEYAPTEDGSFTVTEMAKNYQHGLIGTHFALDAGLPDCICAVIANHTAWSRMAPRTVEGMILFLADTCDSETAKFLHGGNSLILAAMGKMNEKSAKKQMGIK